MSNSSPKLITKANIANCAQSCNPKKKKKKMSAWQRRTMDIPEVRSGAKEHPFLTGHTGREPIV